LFECLFMMLDANKGGHPLRPPSQRGSTPLDTLKGEKERNNTSIIVSEA